ncbi:S8 family serine peptidase [Glycomyces sp. NRRL B-16210]|uniref:S8 family peptidase n=1 Tax=Glycomyces sp. NRRL B-16210 TaxID=1463821 RepID=UPI000B29F864|nr:S8 family serine peptidase [Glycomyces sp. NRRL B-16210]
MATVGTVLLATTPAQAEFTTAQMSGDKISPCTTAPGEQDPLTSRDWSGNFIGLEEAHQFNRGRFKDTGEPVTIAIIDSGVEATRTDVFGERVLPGWDVHDPSNDGRCDANYHGTGVAAIAAGAAQGEQFVGVAPEAMILPLRAFVGGEGADTGTSRMVASLIDDAVANGADVINISITLPPTNELEQAVLDAVAANVVVVAASGNDNLNMDASNTPVDDAKFYPANYPEVIAVGGHNQVGNWYAKTNYGENLDLIAPGDGVTIPYPGGGWLSRQEGTSFAAPYVAGAAALLKGEFGKDTTPSWIEWRLQTTAIHPPNDFSIYQGHGVLNVGDAIATPVGNAHAPNEVVVPDADGGEGGAPNQPQVEPSSIAAIDVNYDPLAFEKTVAWASVGGSIVLVALVLVLRQIIPMGRRRRWRAGVRKPDEVLVKAESD